MFNLNTLTVKNFMSVGNQTQAINFDRHDLTLVLGENLDLGGDDHGARNGTGKTTLARHINGLLKPTSGNVLVFGKNTKKISVASLSKRIGMVFQNSNHQLFADTVKNEILFGLKNFGFDQDYIDERYELMTDLFNLRKYEEISPLKLSGGEKKKVCLASVLAWNPEILILDEPTVGQDELQKNILFEFINTLHSNNKTIIDATCPLVTKVHVQADKFYKLGFKIIGSKKINSRKFIIMTLKNNLI